MKTSINLLMVLLVMIPLNSIFSQKIIAVHNTDGSSAMYQHIDSAIYYAQDNAHVYISGGNFTVNDLIINKPLHVIGVGHHPDSSSATGITFLNGNVKVLNTASGGSLSGIYLTGNFYYGSDGLNQAVSNYTLQRCSINNMYLSYDGSSYNSSSLNSNISQNIIRGSVNGGDARGVILKNNIIVGGYHHLYFFTSAEISNNIFINGNYNDYITACTISNNIFLGGMNGNAIPNSSNNNIYHNNIYIGSALSEGGNGGLIVSNNLQMNAGEIFINQSGITFNYNHNYHLLSNVSSLILGLDGTEVGIYGGTFPYKDGAVPVNPHIQYKQIGNSTLSNGLLPVNIKVNAQEN
ncbi:MAG: hypothetical protein HYU67_00555 [Flavobacteriia bacterium]|nr:hypothetical protein [Flavobacteriia bacterium]